MGAAVLIIWEKKPLNIVIIVMDTVRPDHLSTYGYNRETSPNLSKLAESSKVYYNAYSTSGWTVPAHASLFTGIFPIVHKATQELWWLNDNLKTLAEILLSKGYKTVGIVGNPMLRKHLNFDQGFIKYYETWKYAEKNAKENPAYFLFRETLIKRDKTKPHFIFVNLIEPHSPYDSSRHFYNKFVSDPSVKIESNMWPFLFTGQKRFSEKEIKHLNELYDAEIFYTDYLIGKMVDALQEEDLWDDTIFIVTSDHGENIGDHEMMDHVFSLYESIIRIPLLIHYPKLFEPGSKEDRVVQLTDIFPTLLYLVGVDISKFPSHGLNLLERNSERERDIFSEYYYPKQALRFVKEGNDSPVLKKFKRRIKSLTSDHIKLIWGSDGRHELYDLVNDPGEYKNIFNDPAYSKVKKAMLNKLERTVVYYSQNKNAKFTAQKDIKPVKEILDNDTVRELKSLGYTQ